MKCVLIVGMNMDVTAAEESKSEEPSNEETVHNTKIFLFLRLNNL